MRRTNFLQRRARHRRRGMTSMLAMLFLVLFGTLAIGFYAATTIQSQIVSNDERAARAQLAAESGLDFIRYQLGQVSIPPDTPANEVVQQLYADLRAQLEGTANLGSATVELSGNTISIPAGDGAIALDSQGHASFRATITDWLGEIVVKVDGRSGSGSSLRAISMDFTRAARPINAFDYAVASKGRITMSKGGVTAATGVDPAIATAMSALNTAPSIYVSGGTIGGDLSVTAGGGAVVTGGSVGGSTIPAVIMSDHVHIVDEPEFPEFDTTVFEPFATTVTTGAAGNTTIKNGRVPANTNPHFNGNATVQGILYIESPNDVTINGNLSLQGFIVFEGEGDPSVNQITISGNMTHGPVPNAPEFDAVRAISGVSILAPTASIVLTGNAKGNLRGSLIAAKFCTAGNPADIVIDQGTLMTLSETSDACHFDGKTIRFTATGGGNLPTTGMIYSTYYQPNPMSYQEVLP